MSLSDKSKDPQQMTSASATASLRSSLSTSTSVESELDEPNIARSTLEAKPVEDKHPALDFDSIDFDSFAMQSLQTTAAAILAAQQSSEQEHDAFEPNLLGGSSVAASVTSGSENESGLSRHQSPSSALQRSGSIGRHAKASSSGTSQANSTTAAAGKPHVERHKWSAEETQALVKGCNKHGIGNWKVILSDEEFAHKFDGRTPGDLKDRFRTYFPDAYHELYPNAKTHTSRTIRSKAPDGTSIFEKGKTKERRPFTPAEDEVLKRGYEKYGSHWATIAKEPVFEGKRKSTDLRDRFRNAFPSLYEQAGYKPRAKAIKKERRQSSSGSFSHVEQRPIVLQGDASARGSFSFHAERPGLISRSETSASAHSQAVSEHSDDDFSDHTDWHTHYKARSDGSFLGGDLSLQSAASSIMMRSHSFDAGLGAERESMSGQRQATNSNDVSQGMHDKADAGEQHPAAPLTSPTGSAAGCASGLSSRNSLRRTHSTKKGSSKITSMEHAMKNASIKSNKEALLASHQQQHQQHVQQQQQQQQRDHQEQSEQAAAAAFAAAWSWDQTTTDTSTNGLADMDLDQMDEMIRAQGALDVPQSSRSVADQGDAVDPLSVPKDAAAVQDSSSGSNNASNALLADLYQQLGLDGQNTQTNNRSVAVDSFQDLLDPLAPSQHSMSQWGNLSNAASFAWTPVSSGAANVGDSLVTAASPMSSAQRRDHEHSQWAGDLLHRGNATSLGDWSLQDFVNMANMQFNTENAVSTGVQEAQGERQRPPPPQRLPQEQALAMQDDRTSDHALQSAPAFLHSHPLIDRSVSSSFVPTNQRPSLGADQSYSTPSVHEFISRNTTRRLSNPPRSVGWNEDAAQVPDSSLFASVYRTPYPYPADDMSLLNSGGFAGSMTLFPSLTGGTTYANTAHPSSELGTGSHSPLLRRRRSTDTLRENSFSMGGHGWRGNGDGEGEGMMEESHIAEGPEDNSALSGQSESVAGSHSRSISSSLNAVDDDDVNIPSRAASVSNSALTGDDRDNILYAESLPDLSTGGAFGTAGEQSSSASETTFPNVQHLQMSYDDMDLPSFYNRSPNVAYANPVLGGGSASFSSPRLNHVINDASWLRLFGNGRNGGVAMPAATSAGDVTRGDTRSEAGFRMAGDRSSAHNSALSPTAAAARSSAGHASSLNQGVTTTNAYPIFSHAFKDAGALDRLEHLYLEGLHTPGSPAMTQFGSGHNALGGRTSIEGGQSHYAHAHGVANVTASGAANSGLAPTATSATMGADSLASGYESV